jgi:hypothetical protein
MTTRNLNARIQYWGGSADKRMNKDKLKSLRKALLYSYQAETIELEDGEEYKALINFDKLTGNYDNKILSIPYETEDGTPINVHTGSVFKWIETDTYWLVFLENLEERAYFRAQIRRCDQTVNINGKDYRVYIRGPVETTLSWNQKGGVEWNDANHSLELYITKDEATLQHFQRFAQIKVKEEYTEIERTWQVVACNPYYGDGIIKVSLDEYYENRIKEAVDKENAENEQAKEDERLTEGARILGSLVIHPYQELTYEAVDFDEEGEWYVNEDGTEEKKLEAVGTTVRIRTGKSKGSFVLTYRTSTQEDSLNIDIKSF